MWPNTWHKRLENTSSGSSSGARTKLNAASKSKVSMFENKILNATFNRSRSQSYYSVKAFRSVWLIFWITLILLVRSSHFFSTSASLWAGTSCCCWLLVESSRIFSVSDSSCPPPPPNEWPRRFGLRIGRLLLLPDRRLTLAERRHSERREVRFGGGVSSCRLANSRLRDCL